MASQQSDPAFPSAQVVGNVFVQQFFHVLHQSPELVHRFYQESSKLGRPGVKEEMSTVSTLQAIDEKILSMNYNEYRAQIKTVDAQDSLGGGVIVLVTGCLIGKDNLKKEFTQTFFLATQDNGYYVLNDIFRFVEDGDQQEEEEEKEFIYHAGATVSSEHETFPSVEEHIQELSAVVPEEDEVYEEEIYNHSEHEEGSTVEDEYPEEEVINEVPVEEVINEIPADAMSSKAHVEEVNSKVLAKEVNNKVPAEEVNNKVLIEEVNNKVLAEEVNSRAPVQAVINEVRTVSQSLAADSYISTGHEHKKSYASIVKVMKENRTPQSVFTPAPARAAPVNVEQQVKVMKVNGTVLPVRTSDSSTMAHLKIEQQVISAQVSPPASEVNAPVSENINAQDSEADVYSIYIKNLPLNATPAQLEEEFKKFGAIKPDGIQVRSNKLQGFCFGFVEFEAASALQSAIEASPIMIGNRQAYVEEKRTTGSRANNRGRFLPSRGGGFRGDGMRGRGSYGGGRSYGRGDYNYRSDFGSRGGGRSGVSAYAQGDGGYQRVDHMSSNYERRSRPGSFPSQSNVASRVPASA